jgi:Skp family chaperone for outer membrane proteins
MEQSKATNAGAVAGIEFEAPAPKVEVPQPAAAEPVDIVAIAARVRAELAQEGNAEVAALRAQLEAKDAENAQLRKAKEENEAKQLADHHARGANESHASSKARYAIVIDEARDPNEVNPVFVQVNGRAYTIQRGKVVEVPREVVSVLTDAVENKSIPQVDAGGRPNGYTIRKARRFPFQNYGKIVDENGQRLQIELPREETNAL